MKDKPVGFFDSGLGGASVLKEALRLLPKENYIYYGDNKNAPYGDKDEKEITRLTFAGADFLVSHGVKAMVLACNTATSAAIREIREMLSIPVISVEPAIKPACALPGDGKILMCATLATTRLERYQKLRARMPDPGRVVDVPCPGLADRIEQGVFGADAFDDLFRGYFKPFEGQRIDAIVLGCTHYVFIKDAFKRYAQEHFSGNAALFDGNAATILQLGRVLEEKGLSGASGEADVAFHTSGDRAYFEPLFLSLLRG
ncbi:MAG: glutamate racemase [Bacillota bacterium]